MVVMSDRPIGGAGLQRIPPLPPFLTAEEILRDALPLLDPPSRMTVTDAAERFMRIPLGGTWRNFDRNVTPYMVEPADTTQSRRFQAGIFVGPSQTGKTVMLQTVSMHAVTCNPGPVQVIHMTQADANAWVEEKLDPIIANSPAIFERLGRGREDSTFSRKRFRGMRLTIGYPVPNQLSSRSQRMVLLTDYDHMPQRLGPKDSPEGTPFTMALGRIKTFMSRGFVLVESTPAFPVRDAGWRFDPANPNALPPTTAGVVPLYNEGTRGRWHWECPDCAEMFEPRFDRLKYNADLEPEEAAQRAEMECPHCGALIAHRHKVGLNRAALAGRGGWLHESSRLDDRGHRALCRLDDAELRGTQKASWHLNGAAAAFASWADLVARFEIARREAETTGDDVKLGQVYYTEIGLPYARRAEEDGSLTVQALRDNLRPVAQKTAPSWTRFITTSVDVQGSWFAVSVFAWGDAGERALIDRFDITQPPESAPRARDLDGRFRRIDPAQYYEDSAVLAPLADTVYPVEGQPWGLRPRAVVIDFNGPAGWSDHAEKFWRERKAEGLTGNTGTWFLSFGRGGFTVPNRVWLETPERGSKGKKARAIKLLYMAVDRLKDSVIAAAGRFDGGPGALHFGHWLTEDRLAEVVAEQRGSRGYEKKPGQVRNETLDNAVQALAVAEHLGIHRMNLEAPPDWARRDETNSRAVVLDPAALAARRAAPVATPGTEKPAAADAVAKPEPAPQASPAPAGARPWIAPMTKWI